MKKFFSIVITLTILLVPPVFAAVSGESALKVNAADATTSVQRVSMMAVLRGMVGMRGQTVQLISHTMAGDGGGGIFRYASGAAAGTYVDNGGTIIVPTGSDGGAAWLRDYNGAVYAAWFGATGSGTGDDAPEIQAALNLGRTVILDVGVYRTLSELHYVNGSKLIGSGNYSGVDTLTAYPVGMVTGTSVIRYDGTAGDNVAVVRVSAEAVGVEPIDSATRNMLNVGMVDVVLDGNGKAGIGLYLVRALMNNQFDRITVTNTTRHGFLALACFGGVVNNWMALINRDAGITIGRNVYGWSKFWGVDQTIFNSCWAFRCGYNSSRVLLSKFSDATPDLEYGIGVFSGRALIFNNLQSSYNGGVGIYLEVDRWPVEINGGFVEFNCNSTAASSTRWGIWFKGLTGGTSRHVSFKTIYLSGPAGYLDNIRLTGTEPSRKGEDAVVFQQLPILTGITADWGNYRLIDCDSHVVITGVQPYMIPPVLNQQLNLSPTGVLAFQVAAGEIVSGFMRAGIVAGVKYVSAGIYDVTLNETLEAAKYCITLTGADNRLLGVTNKTASGFRITSRTPSTGAVTDSGYVNVAIFGYYLP